MSDTPRTDAATDYRAPEKLHRLCKELERELKEKEKLLQAWSNHNHKITNLSIEMKKWKSIAERLAEMLEDSRSIFDKYRDSEEFDEWNEHRSSLLAEYEALMIEEAAKLVGRVGCDFQKILEYKDGKVTCCFEADELTHELCEKLGPVVHYELDRMKRELETMREFWRQTTSKVGHISDVCVEYKGFVVRNVADAARAIMENKQ